MVIISDPAAVLNGGNIKSNWCTNGHLLAYDPKWIMETVNW